MPTAWCGLGAPSDHGGVMISASSLIFLNGVQICCQGDSHSCPIPHHGITPISCTTITVSPSGLPIAAVGNATAACGAILNQGVDPAFTTD